MIEHIIVAAAIVAIIVILGQHLRLRDLSRDNADLRARNRVLTDELATVVNRDTAKRSYFVLLRDQEIEALQKKIRAKEAYCHQLERVIDGMRAKNMARRGN